MVALLYYRIIVLFAGERIFRMGTYLAKLQAKWLIASHALFALHCTAQRCRSRQVVTERFGLLVFGPHHMHSIDVAYCYTCCVVVCLSVSVCLSVLMSKILVNHAKTAKLINMWFGMWAWVGPHNHVLQ